MQPSSSSGKVSAEALSLLKSELRGEALVPGDQTYEAARKVWNGMIDRHPAVIVRCLGASDVVKAIRFARDQKLGDVAVKGGGHNVAGNAVCEGGLMIDLSLMKSVRVDTARKTATAEPGATWRQFDLETQGFGLATTGGLVSTTGLAGFTLGGGIGWLVRKYGLAMDNLISVDLVTAEGKVVTASSAENPDLFWGVRGGGGNFGVVTSFEFQLHEVGPLVVGGAVFHRIKDAEALLRFHREFVKTAPDDLTTVVVFLTAPPLPFFPKEVVGTHLVAIAACYAGPVEEGQRELAPLKRFGTPVADLIGPIPYTALQSMFDATAPPGIRNYWKSAYLKGLDDATAKVIVSRAEKMPSPLTAVHIHHLGGAMGRVAEDATAFTNRNASFIINMVSTWTERKDDDVNIEWARDFFDEMRRYTMGAYVNFLGEEGEDRVVSAYGPEKYKRLSLLKAKYDPTNMFHMNQNIVPQE